MSPPLSPSDHRRPRRPRASWRRALAATLALLALALAVLLGVHSHQGTAGVNAALATGAPVFRIVEGSTFTTGTPYSPTILHIPAGRVVAVRLTDHLGGCGLRTIFPGLGVDHGDAAVTVPVGSTGTVLLRAPHAGSYTYTCDAHMYFGRIVAS